ALRGRARGLSGAAAAARGLAGPRRAAPALSAAGARRALRRRVRGADAGRRIERVESRQLNATAEPSIECQPTGQRALAGVAQHLTGVAVSIRYTRAGPHAAGVAPQHDRRRAATVEQDRGVAAEAAEQILQLVRRVAAALEDVHLVLALGVGERRAGCAGAAVVELSGVARCQQPDTAHRDETSALVE